MSARTSWQTLLADLALVLFIITAAALCRQKLAHRTVAAPPPVAVTPPVEASPLAVWRDGPDAPPLAAWLRQQPRDPRQQITIVVGYAPGTERALPQRIAALVDDAKAAGVRPRIVIEPGDEEISAGVGYDTAPMARDLLRNPQNLQNRITIP